MVRIGIILLVVSCILGFTTYKEWRLVRASSGDPEEITLKALIVRGPKGNPNIILTEFYACDNIVYEEARHSKNWAKVWVPIIPPDEAALAEKRGVPSQNIQAIILSTHAKDGQQLEVVLGKPKIRAMVTNEIQSLGSKEKSLLRQTYGGTDMDKWIIIEEGREPAGSNKLFLMGGGSGVLGVAGAVLLLLGLVRKKS